MAPPATSPSGAVLSSMPTAFSFGLPPMDVQLNGQNYREWAFSLKMLLQACGYASHLTEDPPAASTDANDKAVNDWRLDDDMTV